MLYSSVMAALPLPPSPTTTTTKEAATKSEVEDQASCSRQRRRSDSSLQSPLEFDGIDTNKHNDISSPKRGRRNSITSSTRQSLSIESACPDCSEFDLGDDSVNGDDTKQMSWMEAHWTSQSSLYSNDEDHENHNKDDLLNPLSRFGRSSPRSEELSPLSTSEKSGAPFPRNYDDEESMMHSSENVIFNNYKFPMQKKLRGNRNLKNSVVADSELYHNALQWKISEDLVQEHGEPLKYNEVDRRNSLDTAITFPESSTILSTSSFTINSNDSDRNIHNMEDSRRSSIKTIRFASEASIIGQDDKHVRFDESRKSLLYSDHSSNSFSLSELVLSKDGDNSKSSVRRKNLLGEDQLPSHTWCAYDDDDESFVSCGSGDCDDDKSEALDCMDKDNLTKEDIKGKMAWTLGGYAVSFLLGKIVGWLFRSNATIDAEEDAQNAAVSFLTQRDSAAAVPVNGSLEAAATSKIVQSMAVSAASSASASASSAVIGITSTGKVATMAFVSTGALASMLVIGSIVAIVAGGLAFHMGPIDIEHNGNYVYSSYAKHFQGCIHENPDIGTERIQFALDIPLDSIEFDTAGWEEIFIAVYNNLTENGCIDLFERRIDEGNVTLVSAVPQYNGYKQEVKGLEFQSITTQESEGLVETEWDVAVSCWEKCPSEAAFGSDHPFDNFMERRAKEESYNDLTRQPINKIEFRELLREAIMSLLKTRNRVPSKKISANGDGSIPPFGQLPNGDFNIPNSISISLPIVLPSTLPSLEPSASPSVDPSTGTGNRRGDGGNSKNEEDSTISDSVPPPTINHIPTSSPSLSPSLSLSEATRAPSAIPSDAPTSNPSKAIDRTGSGTSDGGSNGSTPATSAISFASAFPKEEPSGNPNTLPSEEPSGDYTLDATGITASTMQPTAKQTANPTVNPIVNPIVNPTNPLPDSTASQTKSPTAVPTKSPTTNPIASQTEQIASTSLAITLSPSASPSTPRIPASLSELPSTIPKKAQSDKPTVIASSSPSESPSMIPSGFPSKFPTSFPSNSPTGLPSMIPSANPSDKPTVIASSSPSESQSMIPSGFPSKFPTSFPSNSPTGLPSMIPSENPSDKPTVIASSSPSGSPSMIPSGFPSKFPTSFPSNSPTGLPSMIPSANPSDKPTVIASSSPSESPSTIPSNIPSESPSSISSDSPTESAGPSVSPTESSHPSTVPSAAPTPNPPNSPGACCSHKFDTCILNSACSVAMNENNCENVCWGGGKLRWLHQPPPPLGTCLKRFTGYCHTNSKPCCAPAVCNMGLAGYSQCLHWTDPDYQGLGIPA